MNDSKCLFESLLECATNNISDEALETKIWNEFGRTSAVLVLDSTGFSRTTQKKGIVYFLSIIAQMRKIGKDIFSGYDAVGFRAEADNLFAEFPTVEKALGAAFEMHQYFEDNPIMLYGDEPYQVCIGIGYGRLLESSHEGMYGDEMNLASKLGEDTADGGQTLVTEAAFNAFSNQDTLLFHKESIAISGVELPYFNVVQKK